MSADPALGEYMRGRPVVGVYRPSNLAAYSYSWNNPVSIEDPDGRCPECTFAALRETPAESAATNEAGKNIAAGMWNSLVRKASATMVALVLGRPPYAPLPTREEIDAAHENSGAKDLEDAALIEDVPLQAELAGEFFADLAIGAVIKGVSPKGVPVPRGQTVLGHGPGYLEKARELGANYFKVSDEAWNAMSDAERWAANQKFLDDVIATGDEIILSTPTDQAKAGSFFARELDYLTSHGYTPSADKLSMLPPPQ